MSLPFDYLDPKLNRPDLYSEQSTIKSKRAVSKPGQSVIANLLVIIMSSLIFITIFAWADVLRSYLDSLHVNEIIKNQTNSRIWFAILATLITCLSLVIIYYFYYDIKQHGHKDFVDTLGLAKS